MVSGLTDTLQVRLVRYVHLFFAARALHIVQVEESDQALAYLEGQSDDGVNLMPADE
jgi:hypothetical protein